MGTTLTEKESVIEYAIVSTSRLPLKKLTFEVLEWHQFSIETATTVQWANSSRKKYIEWVAGFNWVITFKNDCKLRHKLLKIYWFISNAFSNRVYYNFNYLEGIWHRPNLRMFCCINALWRMLSSMNTLTAFAISSYISLTTIAVN